MILVPTIHAFPDLNTKLHTFLKHHLPFKWERTVIIIKPEEDSLTPTLSERNTGHAGGTSSEEVCDSQPSLYTCKRGYRELPDPPELDLVRGEVEGACIFYFPQADSKAPESDDLV